MKTNIIVLSLFLCVVVFIGYRMYLLYVYNDKLSIQKDEWLTKEFIPKRIDGIIYQLDPPTEERCFTNLIIKTSTKEKFASGICICAGNAEFGRFAAKEDSIIKFAGYSKIFVIKPSGEKRQFEFPFCTD